jgi:hypothetical protein
MIYLPSMVVSMILGAFEGTIHSDSMIASD